jgi:hypothetical protein
MTLAPPPLSGWQCRMRPRPAPPPPQDRKISELFVPPPSWPSSLSRTAPTVGPSFLSIRAPRNIIIIDAENAPRGH